MYWNESSPHISIRELARKASEAIKEDDHYLEMLKYYMLDCIRILIVQLILQYIKCIILI